MKMRKISALMSLALIASTVPVTPVSAATVPPSLSTVTISATNGKTGVDDIVTIPLPSTVTTAQSIYISYPSTTGTTATTTQAIGASDIGQTVTFNLGADKLKKLGGSLSVKIKEGSTFGTAKTVTFASQVSAVGPGTGAVVVNEYGTDSDKITIKAPSLGLKSGDIVNVYNGLNDTTTIGAVTLTSDLAATATKEITLTGLASAAASSLYVGLVSSGKDEGTRTRVAYKAEPKTVADYLKGSVRFTGETVAVPNVVVTNSREGQKPKVQIKGGLKGDEIITVYIKKADGTYTTSGGIVLDLANPPSHAETTQAAIKVLTTRISTAGVKPTLLSLTDTTTSQGVKFELPGTLGSTNGNVYITIKATNATESDKFAVAYKAPTSDPIQSKYVQVFNDEGTGTDKIRVTGLEEGDTVYVFDNSTTSQGYKTTAPGQSATSSAIASGTVVGTTATGVTISNITLPAVNTTTKKGTIHLVVQKLGKMLSKAIKVEYSAEN